MAIMTGAGLALLVLFLLVGHLISGGWSVTRIRAAGWFLPVWFLIALLSVILSVAYGGLEGGDAVTALAMAFGVPAVASAGVMWWTCRQ